MRRAADDDDLGDQPENKKKRIEECSLKPIRFQLLDVYYIPEDDHRVYLMGRSADSDIGGVCLVAPFNTMSFHIERKKPFRSRTEAQDFLNTLQDHLHDLQTVTVKNDYKVDDFKDRRFTEYLFSKDYPGFPPRERGSDNPRFIKNHMLACFTSFEIINDKHKTGAYFTPEGVFVSTLKVTVREPYMANSMGLYFESEEYQTLRSMLGHGDDWLVRTYQANVPINTAFCIAHGIEPGRWCTVSNYRVLNGHRQVSFKKTNIYLKGPILCDLDDIEPSPLRILSFDCEMPCKEGFPKASKDPIVCIVAAIYQEVPGVQPKFLEARGMAFKNEKSANMTDLKEWLEKCKKRLDAAVAFCKRNGHQCESDTASSITEFWHMDKIDLVEHHTEMDMIYDFEYYLSRSDIDIIVGWNIDSFDFPYIHDRYTMLCKRDDLRIPNFGALVNRECKWVPHNPGRDAGRSGGGSAKKAKAYSYLVPTCYIMNDGYPMWRKDHSGEKPLNLNSTSQRNLSYPKSVLAAAVALVRHDATDRLERKEEAGSKNITVETNPSKYSLRELYKLSKLNEDERAIDKKLLEAEKEPFDLDNIDESDFVPKIEDPNETALQKMAANFFLEKSVKEIDSFTRDYVAPTGKEKFPMKKIEFKHSEGVRYWETGGDLSLKNILYCYGDSTLPPLILKQRNKFVSQLNYSMVARVGVSNIYDKGQQMKVESTIWHFSAKLHDGLYLQPTKGFSHLHFPGIWESDSGIDRAIRSYGPRLLPFVSNGKGANEGGLVQNATEVGFPNGIVSTVDFSGLYPSIMHSDLLCFTKILTAPSIAHYKVPKYEFSEKPLGRADSNMAGEHIHDHAAALMVGEDTDDLKVTRFHQSPKSIVPEIVADYTGERAKGKYAKGAWTGLGASYAQFIKTSKGEHSITELEKEYRSSLDLTERDKLEREEKELEKIYEEIKSVLSVPEKRDLPGVAQIISDIETLQRDPQLVTFLIRNAINSATKARMLLAPKSLPEDKKKKEIFVLLQILKVHLSLPESERTPINLAPLSSIQAKNADNYQNDVKRGTNSLYGVLMRILGALALPEISATVTARGRELITHVYCLTERMTTEVAKRFLGLSKMHTIGKVEFKTEESPYFAVGYIYRCVPDDFVRIMAKFLKTPELFKMIYGDSVTGDTGVIVKTRGLKSKVKTKRIDEIVKNETSWKDYKGSSGKEYFAPADLFVWQDSGFTKVTKIIRHVCNKPIVRVLTHTGVVDCTEDHSLLNRKGEKVSPKDSKLGDELLHVTADPLNGKYIPEGDNEISEQEAFSMGAFLADGSCGSYEQSNGTKYTWAVNKQDKTFLNRVKDGLPFQTKILDTLESSGVYKLVPYGEKTKDIVLQYRSMFYNKKREKKVPTLILNSKREIRRAFLDGFYAGDESKAEQKIQKNYRFDQKGKEVCTGLWMLCRNLGYSVSLNDNCRKPSIFRLTCSMGTSQRKNLNAIKKIYPTTAHHHQPGEKSVIVYDFETENHHFHVGPGNMVVHNTDSIMSLYARHNVKSVEEAFKVLAFNAQLINSNLYSMLSIEDEKVAEMKIDSKKKSYDMLARMKIEPEKVKWIFAGSEKSDTIPFVNSLLGDCRVFMLSALSAAYPNEKCLKTLVVLIKSRLLDLAMGRVPTYDLAITKKLSKFEPDVERAPQHGKVAQKMHERGAPVHGGDDITYIYARNKITGEIAPDDLDYVLDPTSPLEPDVKTIFEKCVKNPLVNYLLYILNPLTDFECPESAYEEVCKNKVDTIETQKKIQRTYLEKIMFQGKYDIEWRLKKREEYFNAQLQVTKMAQLWGKRSGTSAAAPLYPKQIECCICTKFFDPVNYTLKVCHCDSKVVSASPCECKGKSGRPITHFKRESKRQHISIEYDNEEKEDVLRTYSNEKNNYYLEKTNQSAPEYTLVCPNCISRKEMEIEKTREKHKKTADDLFKARAKCLVCIELAQVPEDNKIPSTPENCKLTGCSVYKERMSSVTECLLLEDRLERLGSHHTSW